MANADSSFRQACARRRSHSGAKEAFRERRWRAQRPPKVRVPREQPEVSRHVWKTKKGKKKKIKYKRTRKICSPSIIEYSPAFRRLLRESLFLQLRVHSCVHVCVCVFSPSPFKVQERV